MWDIEDGFADRFIRCLMVDGASVTLLHGNSHDIREITGLIRTEVTVRNSAKSLSDEHVRTEKEKKG